MTLYAGQDHFNFYTNGSICDTADLVSSSSPVDALQHEYYFTGDVQPRNLMGVKLTLSDWSTVKEVLLYRREYTRSDVDAFWTYYGRSMTHSPRSIIETKHPTETKHQVSRELCASVTSERATQAHSSKVELRFDIAPGYQTTNIVIVWSNTSNNVYTVYSDRKRCDPLVGAIASYYSITRRAYSCIVGFPRYIEIIGERTDSADTSWRYLAVRIALIDEVKRSRVKRSQSANETESPETSDAKSAGGVSGGVVIAVAAVIVIMGVVLLGYKAKRPFKRDSAKRIRAVIDKILDSNATDEDISKWVYPATTNNSALEKRQLEYELHAGNSAAKKSAKSSGKSKSGAAKKKKTKRKRSSRSRKGERSSSGVEPTASKWIFSGTSNGSRLAEREAELGVEKFMAADENRGAEHVSRGRQRHVWVPAERNRPLVEYGDETTVVEANGDRLKSENNSDSNSEPTGTSAVVNANDNSVNNTTTKTSSEPVTSEDQSRSNE